METGWIKLHRKLLDSVVFPCEGLLQLWIWCLLEASHKEHYLPAKTGRGSTPVKLKPGQLVFGRHACAKKLRCKPSTTSKRLLTLEKLGKVSIQSGTHYSIVSITNWDRYQKNEIESDNHSGTQVATKWQPSGTYKNGKNEKNEKNEPVGGVSDETPPPLVPAVPVDFKKKSTARQRKATTPLPDDFTLTPAMRDFAVSKGVEDPEAFFEYFCEKCRADGRRYSDWAAGFRTWAMNEKKFRKENTSNGYRRPLGKSAALAGCPPAPVGKYANIGRKIAG